MPHRTFFFLTLLISLAVLCSALVAQLGFGMKPCIMCLWQRLPYLLLIILCIMGLVRGNWAKILIPLMLLCCVGSAFAAILHFGIEQHWWELSGGCPVEPLGEKTQEQVLAELLVTPTSSCDKVAWRIFGLSITLYNAALSLVMCVYMAMMLRGKKHA
jgi:disulfide bond formation protein DsbB